MRSAARARRHGGAPPLGPCTYLSALHPLAAWRTSCVAGGEESKDQRHRRSLCSAENPTLALGPDPTSSPDPSPDPHPDPNQVRHRGNLLYEPWDARPDERSTSAGFGSVGFFLSAVQVRARARVRARVRVRVRVRVRARVRVGGLLPLGRAGASLRPSLHAACNAHYTRPATLVTRGLRP